MRKKTSLSLLFATCFVFGAAGCNSSGTNSASSSPATPINANTTAHSSLVQVANEPAGPNCPTGGKKIETGVDTDDNGILESSEMDVSYVCNGSAGALVDVVPEPAGANCQFGGYMFESGLDTNGNGVLDSSEVTDGPIYVCNTSSCSTGPGFSCTNCCDAEAARAVVTTIPVSDTTDCPAGFGGVQIITGWDLDYNGQIGPDPIEIQDNVIFCNTVETINGEVLATDEPAGANCTLGGKKLQGGLDLNNNDILDPNESTNTQYLCDIQFDSNTVFHAEAIGEFQLAPGAQCPLGGECENIGIDTCQPENFDVDIDAATYCFCNSQKIHNVLTTNICEPEGMNCDRGGVRVDEGVDLNDNGVLDSTEIQNTYYVCNGGAL